MNIGHVLAQIDLFERAAIVVVVVALIVLPKIGSRLAEHEEESDGNRIALYLTGLTAVGVVIVFWAAIFGPHPA